MLPFAFTVGNVVQLAPATRAYRVSWRGQVRERLPDGSYWLANVYRLDNDFWDCYHESELHSAWRWSTG